MLTPGGVLVFYGAHPCFNGPHVQWMDDGGVLAHPIYRQAGWHQESPWWGMYVRRRVGMRHHPLAELLNAFITTELTSMWPSSASGPYPPSWPSAPASGPSLPLV